MLETQYVGRYRLLTLLGRGGMGEVYLAEDTTIQRHVALKIIRPEAVFSPDSFAFEEANRLFERETRAIALLDHPHILPLYDYGESVLNGVSVAYLVMPYRREGSLAVWLQQYADVLTMQDAVAFIHQAADALQHAHDHHVIHQDVKPANFLVRSHQERPTCPDLFLTDFGIARICSPSLSGNQSVRGTPMYMAPEQLSGHASPASDQYALAIMTYKLLTRRLPFQGGGLGQMICQHLYTQPIRPGFYNPFISSEMDQVILRALAKRPEERFPSICEFADALQQALLHHDSTTISWNVAAPSELDAPAVAQGLLKVTDVPRQSPQGSDQSDQMRQHTPENLFAETRPPFFLRKSILPDKVAGSLDSPSLHSVNALARAETEARLSVSLVDEPTALLLPSPSTHRQVFHKPVVLKRSRKLLLFLSCLLLLMLFSGINLTLLLAGKVQHSSDGRLAQSLAASASAAPARQVSAFPGSSTNQQTVTTLPDGDPYTHSGKLVLNDLLQSRTSGSGWMLGTNQNNASCAFLKGAYQVSQPVNGNFHPCLNLRTNLTDFVFEVQMHILSGAAGGLIFRNDPSTSTFYYFYVGKNGTYDLRAFRGIRAAHARLLRAGSSPAIHATEPDLLAVVARGSLLIFYINHLPVMRLRDKTYSQGQIGVVADDQGSPAIVAYSKARVWAL